jgi:hypothetical protein
LQDQNGEGNRCSPVLDRGAQEGEQRLASGASFPLELAQSAIGELEAGSKGERGDGGKPPKAVAVEEPVYHRAEAVLDPAERADKRSHRIDKKDVSILDNQIEVIPECLLAIPAVARRQAGV